MRLHCALNEKQQQKTKNTRLVTAIEAKVGFCFFVYRLFLLCGNDADCASAAAVGGWTVARLGSVLLFVLRPCSDTPLPLSLHASTKQTRSHDVT